MSESGKEEWHKDYLRFDEWLLVEKERRVVKRCAGRLLRNMVGGARRPRCIG